MIVDIIEFSQNYIVLFLIIMVFLQTFDPRPKYFKWKVDCAYSIYIKIEGFKSYRMRLLNDPKWVNLFPYMDNEGWVLDNDLSLFFMFKFMYVIGFYWLFGKSFYKRISKQEMFMDLL